MKFEKIWFPLQNNLQKIPVSHQLTYPAVSTQNFNWQADIVHFK